jgi:hypothetical protein
MLPLLFWRSIIRTKEDGDKMNLPSSSLAAERLKDLLDQREDHSCSVPGVASVENVSFASEGFREFSTPAYLLTKVRIIRRERKRGKDIK